MKLQKNIKAVFVNGDESGFVAECLEIPVVTQGQTLDEVTNNLKEAVELFLDGARPRTGAKKMAGYRSGADVPVPAK